MADPDDVVDEEDTVDEDEDEFSNLNQSFSYANSAIGDLLKGLIKGFERYAIGSEHLVVISSMYNVVTNFRKYRVNGYLRLDVKEIQNEGNFTFQEILIDEDGLRLSTGGYVTENDNGGDSYSDVVFPPEDEDAALDTVQVVDAFISEFIDKLQSENSEFDAFDSGDGVDEVDDKPNKNI